MLGLASAALLVVAELSTLSYRTIGQGGCETRVNPGVCETSGADAHGWALVLLALFVLVFAFGAAIGRSRPAGLALTVCGAVVLFVALTQDLPKLDDTRGLEVEYTQVRAHTGSAFGMEIVGGVTAVVAGLAALTHPGRRRAVRAVPHPRRRHARRGRPSGPRAGGSS